MEASATDSLAVWTPLPGGAAMRLGASGPVELHAPARTTRASRPEDAWLLAWAEWHAGRWLAWEGRWQVAPLSLGGACRGLRPSAMRPTHRLRFAPDEGREEAWTVVTDVPAGAPADAFAWTHDEWASDAAGYRDGGAWRRAGGVWLHRGRVTPDGRPGVVVVEPVAP